MEPDYYQVLQVEPTADADAISTALFVMGLEAAVAWCQGHPEVAALLVPPPSHGSDLHPFVCNLPADRLFLADDVQTEDA